jgi:hypothetical protein
MTQKYKSLGLPRSYKPRGYKQINHRENPVKVCVKCEKILNDRNCAPSSFKISRYMCARCNNKQHKEWARKFLIGSKHKPILAIKRTRPNNCELCEQNRRRLYYHHWQEDNPSIGLWLCNMCHSFAEIYDKKMSPKYRHLKIEVIEEVLGRSKRTVASGASRLRADRAVDRLWAEAQSGGEG